MGTRWITRRLPSGRPVDRRGRRERRVVRLGVWCGAAMAVTAAVVVAATSAAGAPPNLRPAPQIVGGGAAPIGVYPFMVALQQWNGNGFLTICGGTLIAPDEVLTAAHCVDQWTVDGPLREQLVVGRTLLSETDGQVRFPKSIKIDSAWNSATEADDAALIQLDKPVDDVVSPTLPNSGDRSHEQAGITSLALGWGSTKAQSPTDYSPGVYPDELRQVDLPVVSDKSCQSVFDGVKNPIVYPTVMECAGGDGKHDACTGDSGGPLLSPLAGGTWELIGITSWGDGCAVPGVPGVFTRVSAPEIHDFLAQSGGGAAFGP